MHPRAARIFLSIVLLAPSSPAPAAGDDAGDLRSLAYFPEDAVWAMSSRVASFAAPYDGLLNLLREFAPPGEVEGMLAPLRQWEQAVGVSLRDDLLGVLGGEAAVAVAVDDIDRIGLAVMAGMQTGDLDLEKVLGGVLVVVGVQDPDHFDQSLGRLVASLGGQLAADAGGIRSVHLSREGKDLTLLHYRYHRGFALFGFGAAPLTDAVLRAETGKNLLGAQAYQDVFARLDPGPRSVGFLNLPRAQQLLRGSELVQMAIAENPGVERFFRKYIEQVPWKAGMGWASYEVEGGTLQQSFAPIDMGTFANAYVGMVAAVAVPNFLAAVDAGRQKRTVADIRSIGTALEAYAADHGSYPAGVTEPSPVTDGEHGLERLLVPTYLASLPATDGWGNPIVYRSDLEGVTYLLTSYGKDGAPTGTEASTTAGYAADIHFANGIFLAGAEGAEP
jgi:general secretion pathway protein G